MTRREGDEKYNTLNEFKSEAAFFRQPQIVKTALI
jgi:hypothetical protein